MMNAKQFPTADPPLLSGDLFMVTSDDDTDYTSEGLSEDMSELEDDMNFLASQETVRSDNDAAIAAELNKLSLDEREQILHDLHGVCDLIDETPELLKRSMSEMEELLDSKSSNSIRKSAAYTRAEEMNPTYVKDPKLRLMFLRCEGFKAKAAAEKLQLFMSQKEALFGKDKLCQEITLEDLTESDVECLKNGHFQLLKERDRSGRAVVVIGSAHIQYQTIENEVGAA